MTAKKTFLDMADGKGLSDTECKLYQLCHVLREFYHLLVH